MRPRGQRYVVPEEMKNCLCLKCDHRWLSMKLVVTGVPPVACPHCHRMDWMIPRMRAKRRMR